MPSARKKTNKAGKVFYEIRVSRGRGQSYLTRRWYVPDGWSQKAINKELTAVAAEFERQVKAEEVVSRAEAKQKAADEAAEAAKIQTLKQYGEKVFMPSLSVRCSENTRSAYQGNLDHWIYPALGNMRMPEVTPANITALLLSMQSQGKAQSTCVKVFTILHSLFKLAYMTDTIPHNPMDKVQRPRPRKDEVKGAEIAAYTVEEVQHILDALDAEPLKWRAFVRLLIDTGVRRGECCALRWENVDFNSNTITIAGNLCYTPNRGVYLDTPKNGHTRTVDVDDEVMKILRQLREDQAGKCISAFVFTQEGSAEPMHPTSPTGYFRKFGKTLKEKYGIENFHPHKLRHTFASIAITNGADVASVSEKLGHSDKAVTLRMYTHADQESMKRASNIFRDAIKKQA